MFNNSSISCCERSFGEIINHFEIEEMLIFDCSKLRLSLINQIIEDPNLRVQYFQKDL
jgi:hypothetical protein